MAEIPNLALLQTVTPHIGDRPVVSPYPPPPPNVIIPEPPPPPPSSHALRVMRMAMSKTEWTSEILAQGLESYFSELADNPIKSGKQKFPRVPTIMGYCLHVGVSYPQFCKIRKCERRGEVAEAIANAIKVHTIEGAAVGVFKEKIAMSLTGLANKTESTTQNLTPPTPKADPMDEVCVVHPDDPDPLAPNRMLFSQRQIDAGVQYPMKTINAGGA